MSIAAEVCMYLSLHGEGTRRGMSDALTRNEGSVETATRKLLELGFIREVRRIPSPHGKPMIVFALGDRPFNQDEFSCQEGIRRGRPTKDQQSTEGSYSFDALTDAMGSFMREAA